MQGSLEEAVRLLGGRCLVGAPPKGPLEREVAQLVEQIRGGARAAASPPPGADSGRYDGGEAGVAGAERAPEEAETFLRVRGSAELGNAARGSRG